MGAARLEFHRALEAEIRRNAVEEEKFYLYRRDVEKIGESVGLSAEEATRQFLRLAGEVWVGEIWPMEGPGIPVYGPLEGLAPDWTGAWFDVSGMQSRGKIPYGLNR